MDRKPTKFEVLEKITHGCRVPLARVRDETRDGGRIFAQARCAWKPADANASARLQLAPQGVEADLARLRPRRWMARAARRTGRWAPRTCSSAAARGSSSTPPARTWSACAVRGTTNHAHLNPQDLDRARCARG